MSNPRPALVVLALILLGCAALVLLWLYRAGPGHEVARPVGERMQVEDFAFSVVTREWADLIDAGAEPVRPKGRFLVVTLRVENPVNLVDFSWKHVYARIVDATGGEHLVSEAAQAALDAAGRNGCASEIGPGGACNVALAFDVDPAAGPFLARIEFNGPLLRLITGILFGEQRLRLE
jgi:hypothetical protein